MKTLGQGRAWDNWRLEHTGTVALKQVVERKAGAKEFQRVE